MTTKDWFLLIVPIVSNGVIIFLAQKWFAYKYEIMQQKRASRITVLTKFHKIVDKAKNEMISLNKALIQNQTGNKEIKELNDSINEIATYYASYTTILNHYSKYVKTLVKDTNTIVGLVNDNKGFSEKEKIIIINTLASINETLENANVDCFDLRI